MTWLTILGITLPSLMVFLAVYFTFKQYHDQQTKMKLLESKNAKTQITLPVRLQAYERLILLCERIDFADLTLRLITTGTTAKELESAMLIAVQQEFEHNVTQQLYVSPELWNVLLAAKNKTMDIISFAGKDLDHSSTADVFAKNLMEIVSKEDSLPSQIGIRAIKTESSLWL